MSRKYGCEFRTRHKTSQFGSYVFYCLIDHAPCNEMPRKCKKRKKELAKERHRLLTSFFK